MAASLGSRYGALSALCMRVSNHNKVAVVVVSRAIQSARRRSRNHAWRDTTSHSEDLNSQEHGTDRSHCEDGGWLRVGLALVGIGPSCCHIVSDV